MHKSLLVLVALLLTLALALSACGSKSASGTGGGSSGSGSAGASGSDGGSGSSDKKVNLNIMWQGPQPRHEATLKALDLYTKNHPNVTFTPTYTNWDDFWKKLTTLAASKRMPDIMQQDAAYLKQYVQNDTLADLSNFDWSGVVPQDVLDKAKIDGKLYGIPISGNGQGMIYDVDATQKAGITLPKNGWSWDDYFNFAKEARAKLPKGQYGIIDSTSGWDWYQFYQMGQGKGPVLTATGFNLDKELWYQFQNLYAQFRKDGVVPPADLSTAMVFEDPQKDPIASGKVLMETTSVGAAGAIAGMVKDKTEVISDPTGPKGGGWAEATMFWSVGKNTKDLQAAEEVIKFLLSDPGAGKILATTRGIPLNENIWNAIKGDLKPESIVQKNLLDAATPYALPFTPAPPGWNDWVTAYKAEMEAVMFGKETLDQAYDKITKLGESTAQKLANQK